MNTKKPPLYLVDAYGIIYRSYFAFISRPFRNARGENISAVFGFFRWLNALLKTGASEEDGPPKRMAIIFDSLVPSFRHERYPEYKAKRQKTPEDLHSQVPLIKETLSALGIPQLKLDRWEADDIIATLAMLCKKEGRDCYIASSDKDLLQVVGDGVFQLRPLKGGGDGHEIVGSETVKEEWGVSPDQMLDLLSIMGDSSDNIPGVKGIGIKGASQLISRYGSLDAIYENISAITGATGTKLVTGKESAYASRDLIRLDTESPIPIEPLDSYSIDNISFAEGAAVLFREGIFQLAKSWDPHSSENEIAESKKTEEVEVNIQEEEIREEEKPARPAEEKGSYKSITNIEELKELLKEAEISGTMALDFETSGLDPLSAEILGFSFSYKKDIAYYVPFVQHAPEQDELIGKENYIDCDKALSLLLPLLYSPSMRLVLHNARFDYLLTRRWGAERWKAKILDTMIGAWLLDSERSFISLSTLSLNLLNLIALDYKELVPKGKDLRALPLSLATTYAGEDADYTYRLHLILEEELKKAELLSLYKEVEMPLIPILAEMEMAGISLNSEILKEYGKELEEKLLNIETEIFRLVGHDFNIASPKQVQEVLFVERRLKPIKKTTTGYSTDMSVLEELAKEDPVPAQILRHRTLSKLKNTYVDSLPLLTDKDGRIHTSFIQTGTATGRLSSRDPNLQNIPIKDEEGRRIRSAFIAPPEKVLLSADYSQIELVVLAHFSEDPALLEAFQSGADIHRRTAALIFNIADENVNSEERRVAKTINFGVMYGMSAFRLARELDIPQTEARTFIERYFATYKGVQEYMDDLIAKTYKLGWATTLLGRRRPIPAIRSKNKTERAAAERVAINTPIQGSAADIVKLAMLRMDKLLRKGEPKEIFGGQKPPNSEKTPRLLLQVHDELIYEVPEEIGPTFGLFLQKEMEKVVSLKVPLRAHIEIGKQWGELH